MSGPFDLTGTTAVVTGASRGIGFAMAEALAAAGADIIGVSAPHGVGGQRDRGRGHRARTVVHRDRHRLRGSRGRSRSSPSASAARGSTSWSTTPARSSARPPSTTLSTPGTACSQVNLSSQFVLTQAIARGMLERGRGKIIFTASLLSFQGGINVPGYAAAKSGIAGLTRALANEWTARRRQRQRDRARLHRDRQHRRRCATTRTDRRRSWRASPPVAGARRPISPERRCSWRPPPPTTSPVSSSLWTAAGSADDDGHRIPLRRAHRPGHRDRRCGSRAVSSLRRSPRAASAAVGGHAAHAGRPGCDGRDGGARRPDASVRARCSPPTRSTRAPPPARSSSSVPGFDDEVVARAQGARPRRPARHRDRDRGAARPASRDSRTLKLFPADRLGGLGMIDSLTGPFPDMRFMPSGGVVAAQRGRVPRPPVGLRDQRQLDGDAGRDRGRRLRRASGLRAPRRWTSCDDRWSRRHLRRDDGAPPSRARPGRSPTPTASASASAARRATSRSASPAWAPTSPGSAGSAPTASATGWCASCAARAST